jgi:hypothetical protein
VDLWKKQKTKRVSKIPKTRFHCALHNFNYPAYKLASGHFELANPVHNAELYLHNNNKNRPAQLQITAQFHFQEHSGFDLLLFAGYSGGQGLQVFQQRSGQKRGHYQCHRKC